MARVRFGQGVADVSGRLGGTVFARNASGAYMRNGSRGTNPRTPRQGLFRSILGASAALWGDLTPKQHALWIEAAAGPDGVGHNAVGEQNQLTGQNLFVRSQRIAHAWGAPAFLVPPASGAALPALSPFPHAARFSTPTGKITLLRIKWLSSFYPASVMIWVNAPTPSSRMRNPPMLQLDGGGTGKGLEQDEPEPGGGGAIATENYRAQFGNPDLRGGSVLFVTLRATVAGSISLGPPLVTRQLWTGT